MDLVYGLLMLVIVINHVKVYLGQPIKNVNKYHHNAQQMEVTVLVLLNAQKPILMVDVLQGMMASVFNINHLRMILNVNYIHNVLMLII